MQVGVRLALTLLLVGLAGSHTAPCAVVVEEAEPSGTAAGAGLRTGDRLLSWHRAARKPASLGATQGELISPFEVTRLELEEAPRGPVTVELVRDGVQLSLELPPGDWKLHTRPLLDEDELRLYRTTAEQLGQGRYEEGMEGARALAAAASRRGDPVCAAWYLTRAAERLAGERQRQLAEELWREALAAIEVLPATAQLHSYLWQARGVNLQRAGRRAEAVECHQEALRLRRAEAADSLAVASTLNDLGVEAATRQDPSSAEEYFRQALALRERQAPGSLAVAQSYSNLGNVVAERGDLSTAEDLHRRALALNRQLVPGSLTVAASLNSLGIVAWKRGQPDQAGALFQEVLSIRQQRDPESLATAKAWLNLGGVARQRGDLATAGDHLQRALTVLEEVAPDGPLVAATLNNLGAVVLDEGDLAAAEELFSRSLAIVERLAPSSLRVAKYLNNLGTVARSRGNLAAAEGFHRRALEIRAEQAPGSTDLARSLLNLGNVIGERGDLAAADELLQRALALFTEQAPDSLEVAIALSNLGWLAAEGGDLAEAERFHHHALALRRQLAPDSLDVARSLLYLGRVARERGDLGIAEEQVQQALAISRQLAPESLLVATALWNLGSVKRLGGELDAARDHLGHALAIREKLAPGSLGEAEVLHELALLSGSAGQTQQALDYHARAVAALEAQQGRLGGSERSLPAFRARHLDCYLDYLRLLIDCDQPEQAFHVLERSRAQGLLAMLAERDLVFASDLPAELERRRRVLAASYDRTRAQLADLSPSTDAEAVTELLTTLRQLRRQQDELRIQVRKAAPGLAALTYPQPIDLAGLCELLDPGTVLVAYVLGEESSYLFVVSAVNGAPEPFAVLELASSDGELTAEVQTFHRLLATGRDRGGDAVTLRWRGQRLYQQLLAPAEPWLAAAERLVICPDGALHTLPFAALVRSASDGSQQYLVEWKPLHTVVSATVYAELLKQRPARGDRTGLVVAFGDPLYPSTATVPDLQAPSLLLRGHRLQPLPASRHEVQSVAVVWGTQARVHLGAEATEERVKLLGTQPVTPRRLRVVHFACHGLLDRRFPLDSALALTMPEQLQPGQDNGLLQAWEIFEQVRLDADLVVLSACESGLGKNLRGEGLIGLTRAFQYAGARSIVASLWAVPDRSTACLMRHLHLGLHQGLSTDEALRHAQLTLLRGPVEEPDGNGGRQRIDARQPSAWAGFQLIGEWR